MTEVLTEVAKNIPSLVWGGVACLALCLFREPLVRRLREVAGFKAAGVELSFVEVKLASAAADANRANTVASTVAKRQVEVTRADQERVLRRAQRCQPVLQDRRILWIDDVVANNRKERELLERLGLKLEQVQRNAAALVAIAPDGGGYDLILSDIARPEGEPTGLAFLEAHRQWPADRRVPLIFYVSQRDADRALPPGAFGLTNRPDELLHLIIDALERSA